MQDAVSVAEYVGGGRCNASSLPGLRTGYQASLCSEGYMPFAGRPIWTRAVGSALPALRQGRANLSTNGSPCRQAKSVMAISCVWPGRGMIAGQETVCLLKVVPNSGRPVIDQEGKPVLSELTSVGVELELCRQDGSVTWRRVLDLEPCISPAGWGGEAGWLCRGRTMTD